MERVAKGEIKRLLVQLPPRHSKSEMVSRLFSAYYLKMALSGDLGAIREVLDRTEGKAQQSLALDVSVQDWRQEAQKYGLSESDILAEAKLLIAESDIDSSGEAIS